MEPSGKFTASEREEFIHATQLIAGRHTQFAIQEAQNGKGRRQYKNWSEHELYSLSVGWCFFRTDMDELCKVLENRTESQVCDC